MAKNSAGTFLMHKAEGGSWEKLVDVTTSPATGGEPEMIDITTLSDHIFSNAFTSFIIITNATLRDTIAFFCFFKLGVKVF